MPDLLTPQALATAGPLVLETFFKHYLAPKLARNASEARGDLMYDEAFVLMKTFLEIATKHPVAALQRFGLVRTPAPPWVALHRVLIPQSTLSSAAEFLVTAMGGPEMAYKIAGGSKWWQVRAGSGVEGEWIVMKKDWKESNGAKSRSGSKTPEKKGKSRDQTSGEPEEGLVGDDGGMGQNGEFRKEMDEMRCMLYIHGGAYYWGSINTHRYTIWRYARKMRGRCFAVNYRKAPQYPFPCAIQDCLAAYLYLVNPPPDAKHKPVDPKNIVLAGDSAGGGLVWALLQILRDTEGLTLPAGAVLISPWSDLTHSFPSILSNTATDIVPPYGFIHKPSSLWPPPPPALTEEIQNNLRTRVRDAVSRLRGDHHMSRRSSVVKTSLPESPVIKEPSSPADMRSSSPGAGAPGDAKEGKQSLHPISERNDEQHHPGPTGESTVPPHRANPAEAFRSLDDRAAEDVDTRKTTLTLCDTPMKLEVKDKSVLIDTQIQLYATNAQLCHPWVSPILGYLGGLPPLLIIAGDKEVLRDEILYAAHKAAHPHEHPIRDDVRAQLPSLQGIEERYGPTDVHLQVYDGACHDLPLFSMTKISRGLFRAIASFARYVTPSAPGSLAISRSHVNSPGGSGSSTPAYPRASPSSENVPVLSEPVSGTPPFMTPRLSVAEMPDPTKLDLSRLTVSPSTDDAAYVESPRSMSTSSLRKKRSASKFPRFSTMPVTWSGSDEGDASRPEAQRHEPSGDDAGPRFGEDPADQDSRAKPGSAGHTGIYRGDNPFKDHMIRERVATDGICRPLEPAEELCAMTMPRDEVGMIKEGPAIRYLNGQSLWDKKFKHAIKTVERHRKRNLKDAHDRDVGKISKMWDDRVQSRKRERGERVGEVEHLDPSLAASPRAGEDEAGWETDVPSGAEDDRSDAPKPRLEHKREKKQKTVEEELVEGSWSWSWALDGEAPPPSAIVSRRDFAEARQLALMADRMDTAHDSPVHGLSIWVGLAAFFSSSSERNKAHDALKRVHEVQKAEKAERGTLPGLSAPGRGIVETVEKEAAKGERKVGRMGRMFGLGRK